MPSIYTQPNWIFSSMALLECVSFYNLQLYADVEDIYIYIYLRTEYWPCSNFTFEPVCCCYRQVCSYFSSGAADILLKGKLEKMCFIAFRKFQVVILLQ